MAWSPMRLGSISHNRFTLEDNDSDNSPRPTALLSTHLVALHPMPRNDATCAKTDNLGPEFDLHKLVEEVDIVQPSPRVRASGIVDPCAGSTRPAVDVRCDHVGEFFLCTCVGREARVGLLEWGERWF